MRGQGCVPCGPAQAHGVDRAALAQLFQRHGLVSGDAGRPTISSKKKLCDALKAEGHATGNEKAEAIVVAILREHCARKGSAWRNDRPVLIEDGPRAATIFTWRGEVDG
jgi:hypothetical protein